MLVSHLINDHKVDLHEGCTFNHRYVKSNPHQMESATWMLTVSAMSPLCISSNSVAGSVGNIPDYSIIFLTELIIQLFTDSYLDSICPTYVTPLNHKVKSCKEPLLC
jgi:hypothetical protein